MCMYSKVQVKPSRYATMLMLMLNFFRDSNAHVQLTSSKCSNGTNGHASLAFPLSFSPFSVSLSPRQREKCNLLLGLLRIGQAVVLIDITVYLVLVKISLKYFSYNFIVWFFV